nr:anti-sigma factor [Ramlibacter cellulosilyticus]
MVDRLAAAYVLGTLSQRARRRFERLHRDRADVQLAVGGWEARLNRLAASVPPVPPPHRVWQGIAQHTRPRSASGQQRARWWMPAGVGALGVLAGGTLAAALLFALPSLLFTPDQVAMRMGQKLPQSYVGLLTDAQGNAKLLVSSLRHGRTMTLKVLGPIAEPAAGRLVLWAVPADGAPFMLGTIPMRGSETHEMPDTSEKLLSRVSRLVVTAETEPNPTTPSVTLFTGTCAKLW